MHDNGRSIGPSGLAPSTHAYRGLTTTATKSGGPSGLLARATKGGGPSGHWVRALSFLMGASLSVGGAWLSVGGAGCVVAAQGMAATVTPAAAPASAAATTAAAATATSAAPATLAVDTLQMLQDRDQTLKDFTAKIRYEVYHSRTEDTDVQKGDVSYLKDQDGAKFAVHFTLQGSPPEFHKADRTLVFDGRWLIDSDASSKVFQKTQLVPPGAQIKPLKLGEGPIPIPIGQDTQKVLHDFTVTVEPTDPKMPEAANLVHLKLVPRSTELSKAYAMNHLEIWVDRKLQLPVKLVREELDPSTPTPNTTTVSLSDLQINIGAAKVFSLPTPKATEGWDVRVETLEKKQ